MPTIRGPPPSHADRPQSRPPPELWVIVDRFGGELPKVRQHWRAAPDGRPQMVLVSSSTAAMPATTSRYQAKIVSGCFSR